MVSQPCPYRGEKKLVPSGCLNPERFPASADDGLKIHAIAMNVSGIIESSPSTVANIAPRRIPRTDGMKTRHSPTIEITTVQYAIGVLIGVKLFCDRSTLSTM